MNRKEAVVVAREVFGEMGTIVSYDNIDGVPTPKAVWRIGEMDKTIGRGKTWPAAFAQSLKKLQRMNPRKTEADLAEHNRLDMIDAVLILALAEGKWTNV